MHTVPSMLSSDIPVLHLVNRFWIGGAERQFVERLRRHPKGFRAVVGCLEASGPMLEQVRALGYEPHVFPLHGSMMRPNTAVQIGRMASLIRREGIKIVHGTDFNTNLLAFAAGRLAGAVGSPPLGRVLNRRTTTRRPAVRAVRVQPMDQHDQRPGRVETFRQEQSPVAGLGGGGARVHLGHEYPRHPPHPLAPARQAIGIDREHCLIAPPGQFTPFADAHVHREQKVRSSWGVQVDLPAHRASGQAEVAAQGRVQVMDLKPSLVKRNALLPRCGRHRT